MRELSYLLECESAVARERGSAGAQEHGCVCVQRDFCAASLLCVEVLIKTYGNTLVEELCGTVTQLHGDTGIQRQVGVVT